MSTSAPAQVARQPAESFVYDSDRCPPAFLAELLELIRFRDLVWQWSSRNLKLRYKRSALGVVWTLLEPLLLMVILAIVFSTAFRFPIDHFAVYLLSGMLVYNFVSRSTVQMVEEIIAAQSLATRIHVPRSAFGVASIGTHLVNWLISLVPLAGIMLFFGHGFSWSLLTLPVGMLLTALFALGVGLMVATLGAFFHDFLISYQVLLTAWLYATPIIYPFEIVPERYRGLFRLNPLLHLCELVRAPIYDQRLAAASTWAICLAVSVGTLVLGWWIFTRWRMAFDYRT